VNQDRSIFLHSSLHARIDYWSCAIKIFLKDPFWGTGWGDFFHDYTKIKTFPGDEAPHTPHNFILAFASQCGILGLLAAVSVLFVNPFLMVKKILEGKKTVSFPAINLAILCGWIAWALHSLTDLNLQIPGTVATAIIMAMIFIFKYKEKSGIKINRVFANFAILILSAIIFSFSMLRLRGEIYFNRLYKICSPSVPEENNATHVNDMEKRLSDAMSAMTYSPYPWASAGIFAQNRHLWAMSEKFYSEAIKRSPERASFYYRKAISQKMLGKPEEALENISKASSLFPNNQEYKKTKKILEDSLEKNKINKE
jgi:hypothetical protein